MSSLVSSRILIIRPGAIGDTLLAFPVIQALRACYEQPHVMFVGNPAILPLAQAYGIADATFDYGHAQWSEMFSAQGIRSRDMLALLQSTALAVCWLRDSDGILERNLRAVGVKRVIIAPGRPGDNLHIHVTEYLAGTVGVTVDMQISQDEASRILKTERNLHQSHQFSEAELMALMKVSLSFQHSGCFILANLHNRSLPGTIAIHPGSGGARKCWPVSSFAATIKELLRRQVRVFLLAGPADHERLDDLLRYLGPTPDPELLTVLVDAPLLNVAEQLRGCQGYLGNDSGITHLAASLGIPTVVLFGPTDPRVWRPIGPAVHVLQRQPLQELSIGAVMQAIDQFLLAL